MWLLLTLDFNIFLFRRTLYLAVLAPWIEESSIILRISKDWNVVLLIAVSKSENYDSIKIADP